MEAANELESIGDILETNLVGLGLTRIEEDIRAGKIEVYLVSAECGPYETLASRRLCGCQQWAGPRSHNCAEVSIGFDIDEVVAVRCQAVHEVFEPYALAGGMVEHQIKHEVEIFPDG